MYDIFLIGNPPNSKQLKSKYPFLKNASSILEAKQKSLTKMFWAVGENAIVKNDFNFDYEVKQWDQQYIHCFKNGEFFDGVLLVPKDKDFSHKELEYYFFVDKKEVEIEASVPNLYEVFTIDTYEEYLYALENSKTEMFWATSRNIKIADDFKFDIYFEYSNVEDRKENHAFIHLVNDDFLYNGLFLFSKHKPVTEKEITHRHLIERKEWSIIASGPVQYDIFEVDSYDEYLYALENSKTELFWATSRNIKIADDFKFDLYFTHENTYDRTETHAFIHRVDDKDLYNGVFLFSKHKPVTKKEIEHRHIIERKEWSIIASGPVQYDIFEVDSYDEYLLAMKNSKTEMFWATSRNIKIADDFKFDLYFDASNDYDRKENHVFIHEVDGDFLYNGLFLFSKHKPVTEKEIEYRHIIENKEWSIIASGPVQYDIFEVDSYDEYLYALENSKTELFWATSRNIKIADDFKFDLYFTHQNIYDRNENHALIHRVDAEDFYNGLFLFSKHKPVTEKEITHRHIIERKEWPFIASGPVQYQVFTIDTYEEYLYALENSKTEMFWATSRNIKIADDFDFDIYFNHNEEYDRKENHAFIHRVEETDLYNGLFLFSKHKPVTEKEIEHRHIIDRKEWQVIASGPVRYDIFEVDSYDEYLYALENSKTELFWATSRNIKVLIDLDLYFDASNEYDRKENHIFIHEVNDESYYNGLFLFSKHKPVTEKEITHRHIIDKKVWEIIASGPVKYDIFEVDSYDEYLYALENSKTELFWATSRNIKIADDFKFDIYFTFENTYDRTENHSFINEIDGEEMYNGVFLFSKHKPVTEKEIEHRHIVGNKQWGIVASGPVQYDIFEVDSYDEYLYALENSKTELFWATSRNIKIADDFKFDIYFNHNNEYDRKENHAFIHRVDDEDMYNGLFLFSKHKSVSEKEINHRYLIDRKEWNLVASGPAIYDKFIIDTYEDYCRALETSKTEMFWMIPKEVEVINHFDFDLYFPHNDEFNRTIHHSFRHMFRDDLNYNGISLISKNKPLSEKEIKYRSILETKHYDFIASKLKPYDAVFISYNEPNADENYFRLLDVYPNAKRVHGVKGIHNAHIEAAKLAETEMFWVVDGDAYITDEFLFNYEVPIWDQEAVHVWKSRNPINDLVYGYGGVKLLPRKLTLALDTSTTDMTTSISSEFKVMEDVSNVTAFNTDPFNTWKSAFRECVKLSSKAIDRQLDEETSQRLEVWKTVAHGDFAEYAIRGANDAEKFVAEGNNLSLINDFDYLQKLFNK
jgi:predicted transcriptional regulator